MENGRTAGGKRALEGRGELLRALHSLAVTAESLSQNREIRVLELGGDDPSWELALLVHADRAIHAVVEHDHDDRTVICTAVASSWPFIMKSPSPAKATAIRSGSCRFATTAAGTP